ncbi:MAG TPA: F0F1 ATP synthase subunit A [Candidatus Saccharimonadaceae bacterium]|jgi:F-type H+-transporting ATPase subunit a|nr:F0F1 ATP synthase subunit A [Candidatus Saccharimonadaceae bacterium]
MGLEFLARVRRTSLWLSGLAALMVATYLAPLPGLAIAAGAAWSLANLEILERLIVTLTGTDRAALPSRARAFGWLFALALLFGGGALLLGVLPAGWLMIGFGAPFAVMVAKAVSGLLLATGLWARLTRSSWRAALLVIAVGGLAWLAVSALPRAGAARAAHATAVAAQASGEAAAAGSESQHEGQKELGFPTVVTLLEAAAPEAGWVRFVVRYESILFSALVALILGVIGFFASRNPQLIPGPLQNAVEGVVEFINDFLVGILGPRYGPRYVPFLGTLFLYIFAMNLFGLLPFMHSPTASLNVTFALAITVFVYVQYTGFKELGVIGYVDHMLGSPRDMTGWILAPLMLPIHLLGELAKPISLSCRLFGNIFGEDMLLVAFASLGISMLAFSHLPFGIPMHALFFPLALLSSGLQAMVFTVLSTIYFLLMLPHEDHEHDREAHPAH